MHVTVLMAAYNEGSRVRLAVESIQSQTYADWDLLIVDDASTDSTPEILQELAASDQRISILRNQVNRGLAASLNIGWRKARGDLIARMDADDVSLSHRLQRQVAFMTEQPEVAVLGGGAELTNAEGHDLGWALRPETHVELASRILFENPFFHPTVMVRRSFYEALNGYDEGLRRAQDRDLWFRGYRRFRFHNLREPLIRYCMRRKPTLRSIFWGTLVLARAVKRDDQPIGAYWYPLRYLMATLLMKAGLWKIRLR
jgi:glycosyltransferase involved in cell wall biosynthesis